MKRNLLLVTLLVSVVVSGQDTSDDPFYRYYALTQKKYTFAFQPMQLFNLGWRFDFEMRHGDGPGWLQFGPAVYYKKNDDKKDEPHYFYDGNDYRYMDRYSHFDLRVPFSKIAGGGLDVNYKYFVNAPRSFYHAAGISYTRFKIDYWGMAWENYTEDGLQYHAYVLDYRTQHINRLGINAFFGCQVPARNAFLFDIFWGFAYRHSFSNKDKPSFNRTMLSYGHTGFVFLTGVRIGFGIR